MTKPYVRPKITVPIEEASKLSHEGDLIVNPNFGVKGSPDEKLRKLFKAHYLIHWRPNGSTDPNTEFAYAEQI